MGLRDPRDFYVAACNSDLTEGRGHTVAMGFYEWEEDAVAAVKGMGVMGVGDGEVYRFTYSERVNSRPGVDRSKKTDLFSRDTLVYGYHKSRITGDWRRGYVDGRDLPQTDPEFTEFLRLKAKFDPAP